VSRKNKSDDLSRVGEKLLRIAEGIAEKEQPEPEGSPPLSEFVHAYREWIIVERGRPGTQQEQAERWQLIVHGLLSASDVEAAIRLLIRYARVMWDRRGPSQLRIEGDSAVLVFTEPFRPGPEGLMAALWHLALTVCELEFLANATFPGVSGRVVHDQCLPEGVARLLFGRSLKFSQPEVALVIPRHQLRRPIVARSSDLSNFFSELLPLTLGSATREPLSIRSLVSGMIRDDKRGAEFRDSSLEAVSSRLGMSSATLRRRLADEGVSFREVRDETYNTLTQAWLLQNELAIEEIAARLGYSDSYAFRRFFRRLNGCSPSEFRLQFR